MFSLMEAPANLETGPGTNSATADPRVLKYYYLSCCPNASGGTFIINGEEND